MKKILFAAAVAAVAMSCSTQTTAEKRAAYEAAVNELMEAYQQETISDDEVEQKLIDLSLETIRKNADDSVALDALSNIYYMVDNDVLEEALSSIKGDMAQSDLVVKVKSSLEAKKATAEGMMFTDFTVVQDENDPEGSTVKFSDYVGKGKYVLVDFWASWCGPCKREIPNIAAVYDKYHGDDFDVLSVAVWDKPEDTKIAAAEHNVVWNQIINAQKIPTDIYGIDGIPHIILFGPDGTIVKRDLRGEAIEAAVSEALGR